MRPLAGLIALWMLEDSNVGWGGGLKALHANLATRNITQCWFAYAAPANPANFQIPCKRLPSFFSAVTDQGQQQPVPEQIDGPIFISSEELNGSFWASATRFHITASRLWNPRG